MFRRKRRQGGDGERCRFCLEIESLELCPASRLRSKTQLAGRTDGRKGL